MIFLVFFWNLPLGRISQSIWDKLSPPRNGVDRELRNWSNRDNDCCSAWLSLDTDLMKKQNLEKKSVVTLSAMLISAAMSGCGTMVSMKSIISSTVSSDSFLLFKWNHQWQEDCTMNLQIFFGLVNIACYLNITAGRFLNPCRLNSGGGRPGGTVTTTNCIPEDTWEAFNINTMNTLWHAGHAPYFLPSNPLLKMNVSWWLSSFIHIKTKENIKLLDFLYYHNLEDTFSSWHRV